jgi:dipeptidase
VGTDLVRLILERSRTARQAVDCLIELVAQHGQSERSGSGERPPQGDSSFLIADAKEAFAVETAGRHWVYQEIREVRAAGNACIIRQDWNRISPGLSDYVIGQGWWPADGSKLDFAGAVTENPMGHASGLRRWGRATLLLEEQNGNIDSAFVRRVLGDHYEGTHFEVDPLISVTGPTTLCQHGVGPSGLMTATSLVAQLGGRSGSLNIIWCAFGPPCCNVYFPLFVEGEIPEVFVGRTPSAESVWARVVRLGRQLQEEPEKRGLARETFSRLQARLDQDSEEFAAEAGALKSSGALPELQRQAAVSMQHSLEMFELALASLQKIAETHSVLA